MTKRRSLAAPAGLFCRLALASLLGFGLVYRPPRRGHHPQPPSNSSTATSPAKDGLSRSAASPPGRSRKTGMPACPPGHRPAPGAALRLRWPTARLAGGPILRSPGGQRQRRTGPAASWRTPGARRARRDRVGQRRGHAVAAGGPSGVAPAGPGGGAASHQMVVHMRARACAREFYRQPAATRSSGAPASVRAARRPRTCGRLRPSAAGGAARSGTWRYGMNRHGRRRGPPEPEDLKAAHGARSEVNRTAAMVAAGTRTGIRAGKRAGPRSGPGRARRAQRRPGRCVPGRNLEQPREVTERAVSGKPWAAASHGRMRRPDASGWRSGAAEQHPQHDDRQRDAESRG